MGARGCCYMGRLHDDSYYGLAGTCDVFGGSCGYSCRSTFFGIMAKNVWSWASTSADVR
jgi:hypothetical protein